MWVRSDETFCPIRPQNRSGLFKATVGQMRLMLSDASPSDITDDEEELRKALLPLVYNRNGLLLGNCLLLSMLCLVLETRAAVALS